MSTGWPALQGKGWPIGEQKRIMDVQQEQRYC